MERTNKKAKSAINVINALRGNFYNQSYNLNIKYKIIHIQRLPS